jgi:hypothetical protein
MGEDRTPGAPTVPPAPLIYLDVDDEITSAASRIRSAEGEELALVLPYGSRLATSRINFRLLAREAEERGKRIQVVTADASARALATAAGLSVHPSVAAFEGRRSGIPVDAERPMGGGSARAAGDGAGGAATPSAASGEMGAREGHRAVVPGDDDVTGGPGVAKAPVGALSIEDDAPTRVITLPRRRSERVPIVGPARPPVRTGLAVGVGLAAVVLVAAGGLLALELLPSATIVLAPRSAPVGPLTLSVEARVDATTADPETLVVPAERVPFSLEAEQPVAATGVKVTETSATGNVTFSNFDTGSQNRIEAGAVVSTESGTEYRTLAEVTLPPARIQFPFTVVPSTSTVAIEAVEPGPEGNVGNNSITVVPQGENRRLLQVSNDEATSGGSRLESPEISQADVDAAIAALDAALAAELDRQIAEQVGVPAGVKIFEQTRLLGERLYAPEPATLVGTAGPDAILSVTAQGTVLGVDPSPIEGLAAARLAARVPEGWSLAPGSTTFVLGTPTLFGDVVSYPVTIGATQVHDVDQEALRTQVRGRLIAEARAILDDFGDVEITVWPDWVTTIPKNEERIELTVGEPRPAPSPTPSP